MNKEIEEKAKKAQELEDKKKSKAAKKLEFESRICYECESKFSIMTVTL
jgi:hypothetical protein